MPLNFEDIMDRIRWQEKRNLYASVLSGALVNNELVIFKALF